MRIPATPLLVLFLVGSLITAAATATVALTSAARGQEAETPRPAEVHSAREAGAAWFDLLVEQVPAEFHVEMRFDQLGVIRSVRGEDGRREFGFFPFEERASSFFTMMTRTQDGERLLEIRPGEIHPQSARLEFARALAYLSDTETGGLVVNHEERYALVDRISNPQSIGPASYEEPLLGLRYALVDSSAAWLPYLYPWERDLAAWVADFGEGELEVQRQQGAIYVTEVLTSKTRQRNGQPAQIRRVIAYDEETLLPVSVHFVGISGHQVNGRWTLQWLPIDERVASPGPELGGYYLASMHAVRGGTHQGKRDDVAEISYVFTSFELLEPEEAGADWLVIEVPAEYRVIRHDPPADQDGLHADAAGL